VTTIECGGRYLTYSILLVEPFIFIAPHVDGLYGWIFGVREGSRKKTEVGQTRNLKKRRLP
jgi:hypothetical protein